jgi:hypothetical protein
MKVWGIELHLTPLAFHFSVCVCEFPWKMRTATLVIFFFLISYCWFCFEIVTTAALSTVPGYRVQSITKTDSGYRGVLKLIEGSHGPYGNDIPTLQLDVRFETWERLHVKISAPGRQSIVN